MNNAADPKQVARAKAKSLEREEQNQFDLKALLKLAEFRRYVWRHMNETCGLLKSAANANGSIQSQNIGMQEVARALWAEIEQASPMTIPQMMTEYHQAQAEAK